MWKWLSAKSEYQQAVFIVNLLSQLSYLRSIFSWPNFLKRAAYDGRAIAVVALFEKGVLRSDIVNLLQELRRQNIYIFGVNTLKLKKNSPEIELFDTYVETFNFGRDFGMYKFAFTYIFKKGWQKICPRLLMLNDSIYFSRKGLANFITDMITSDKDALGATENFEIEHHLGSFCISFSNFTLNHKRFKRFWKNYQRTDVRPKVIKRGEMGLSKALKKIARHQKNFASLYDVNVLRGYLQNKDNIGPALNYSRVSALVHWRRTSPTTILKNFLNRFDLDAAKRSEFKLESEDPQTVLQNQILTPNYKSMFDALEKVSITNRNYFDHDFIEYVRNDIIFVFLAGSQIHQNPCLMLSMGLPIVKMDGFYRGMFLMEDVNNIVAILDEWDEQELFYQLTARPFGGDTLRGWKRAAFLVGLI